MIECPVCGEEHPPGAYRCDECGRDLVSVDRDDDGGSMPLVADGGQAVDATEFHDHYGIVGDCAGCGGQMIETTCLETDEERRVTLECQDCGAEGDLRHDFDEGLEGGCWSGVGNPEFKPLNWIQCSRCYGHGYVEDPICDLRRAMNGREHPCPNCHTTGKVPRVVETDGGAIKDDTYQKCTVEQWEKKAEIALMNGDMGEAMKYAHYANLREQDSDNDHKLATDGGRDVEQFYVVNESRSAVVDGPFTDENDAAEEASERGPEHIVASGGAIELLQMTSNATIRWENDDVDLVTDGGITGPTPQPDHPKPERFGRNKAFLGPDRHLCDECGRVFDELQELAYHDCALLPDGGVAKFERQDVEAVRREGDRVDQGPCPHTDPGDELPCPSCFVDGILGGDR